MQLVNSLFITMCSCEHKVFTDEKSSAHMVPVDLHRGHVPHQVLRHRFAIYDLTALSWKRAGKVSVSFVIAQLISFCDLTRLSNTGEKTEKQEMVHRLHRAARRL